MLERAPGREPCLKADEPAEERNGVLPVRLEVERQSSRSPCGSTCAASVVSSNGTCVNGPASEPSSEGVERFLGLERFAHGVGRCVDRDEHRAPHVRHATASPATRKRTDAHARARRPRPCVHAHRPARQEGEALRLQGQEGGRVLLPEGRHARVHDAVVRAARRRARPEEAEGRR